MDKIKVIIPVAGIGSKLRPHTHTQPKALMPVAGKAILGHLVDYLVDAGLNDFVFIIGYMGSKVENYIKEKYSNINANFIVQEPREGIGHAVWMAKDFVKDDDELLILLGDTITDFDLSTILGQQYSMLGVKKVEDPRQFGVAELDQEGFITKLIEKPSIPKSNLALVGIYLIKEGKKLMESLDQLMKNNMRTLDEYQLTDGIMGVIDKGSKVRTFQVGNWFDCGSKDSLIETNATLLGRNVGVSNGGPTYHNTIIIQPVSIEGNCDIQNSIIGPNVSIGENAVIKNSILSDCIIGSYSRLNTAVLSRSVVGSDSLLTGHSQSLNIGDSTEIDFT